MNTLPFAATTPIYVKNIGLKTVNGEQLAAYYRNLLGLKELAREGGSITLGTESDALLVIEEDRNARPDDPREAGLFHTAFLFPERADLARWVRYAMENNIAIEGASDHLVSEALYLTDPDGNGIEIYADRPSEKWSWTDGFIEMKTLPLDLAALVRDDEGRTWQGAPEGTVIGHVHLRVGNTAEAERWWNDQMGFDTMAHYGNAAVFMATGGYHHHIGANTWRSSGAGRRDASRVGLSWVQLHSNGPDKAERELEDPWGTVIRISG